MINKKEKIVDIVVTIIVMINTILTMMGYNPIPYSEEEIYVGISAVVAVGYSIYMWIKNNKLTDKIKNTEEEVIEMQKRAEKAEEEVARLQAIITKLGDIAKNGN
jgi:SPP1 family holin